MKTGDLVKFNHRNHFRSDMTGLILRYGKRRGSNFKTLSVLWGTGEIVEEWPTYLLQI